MTYVTSIFLYNCELWTISEDGEANIDGFHRKLLRTTVLNIKWPKKMSNEDVYKITRQSKWSEIIKLRRASWFGHLLRLPETTPARQALSYALKPMSRTRGRPKLNWIRVITEQLKNDFNLDFEAAIIATVDKKSWARTINSRYAKQ